MMINTNRRYIKNYDKNMNIRTTMKLILHWDTVYPY